MKTLQSISTSQRYWLIAAIVSIVLALIFWIVIDKEQLHKEEVAIESDEVEPIQPEKVASTKGLGAFSEEVKPLQLTKRIVAVNSDHGAAFRGTKFMQTQGGMWTVELFRAAEEAVVLSYFKHYPTEKNLVYIRISGDGQEEAYVVLYGLEKTQASAEELAKKLEHLGLPESITPVVRQVKYYSEWVTEVGSEEVSSKSSKFYEVNLKQVAIPVYVPAAAVKPSAPTVRPTP